MIDVLYIEDNPNDADIFSRLIQKSGKVVTYTVLDSGTEAIEYMTGRGRYLDTKPQLPKLLLLDLNLTGMSGVEVVEQMRAVAHTQFLPIVAFTTSDNPQDIALAYKAGVNAYVVKPGDYQGTGVIISSMCDFWLTHNMRMEHS